MRVIAGSARGTRLKAPKGLSVRPTADRVKEALFNIIAPRVIDCLFIDLFAGSGAVGIEALSRGAGFCIFNEQKIDHLEMIKDNLSKTGLAAKARLICADAEKTIGRLAREEIKADLLFVDPPYQYNHIAVLVEQIINRQLVKRSGLIIVEHASRNNQWTEAYTRCRLKRYGDTSLTFIPASVNR